MANFQDISEMWQGSHNPHGTQKESHTQSKQVIGLGYISHTGVIIKAFW
jgi:hypothetical protein